MAADVLSTARLAATGKVQSVTIISGPRRLVRVSHGRRGKAVDLPTLCS